MPRSVLFIAYQFPPVGGAGVQRATKFVKYLPHWGWQPSVLTVSNPSVPLLDESLAADIPEGTIIRRARTWEPSYALKASVSGGNANGNHQNGTIRRRLKEVVRRVATLLLQPDPNILWMPNAIREGNRLLSQIPHDAIVATGPPFSSFVVGAKLSQKHDIPLVLDYRDEWEISSSYWENKRLDPLSQRIQSAMQAKVVRSAQALVASTKSSARALEEVCRKACSSAEVTWIYNGFDPDDFPPSSMAPRSSNGCYRIVYLGTLWNLTSVTPFVAAVQDLSLRRPDLAGKLELHFAGRRTAAQNAILAQLESSPARLVEHPYLHHKEAVGLLCSADMLLLLLSDLPGLERVVPAKIFEYMAAQRPILAIAPRGETWELLRESPSGYPFMPRDIRELSRFLEQRIEPLVQKMNGSPIQHWNPTKYDRKNQARQLAVILNSLT
jgi:glycosyltransferase involved in cell wall biosynthesis